MDRREVHLWLNCIPVLQAIKAKAKIGRNVMAVQGDVASLADLDRLYLTVKKEKGALDIVIANAGIVE